MRYFFTITHILGVIHAYNVLSFSGGGSFGAVEIGILSRLSDTLPKRFDIYTGISAGGLNAGFLSYFENVADGLPIIREVYSSLRNSDIYCMYPMTNSSILNTKPLENTVRRIISTLGKSVIPTMIGTTNLYTGYLDTYYYDTLAFDDQVKLLMATSAIPIVFPPVYWKDQLYVDGGEISNQILEPVISSEFINVTYITTTGTIQPNYNISSFEDIVKRNAEIVLNTFDNSIYSLTTNCGNNEPRGIIYMYYVDSGVLADYSALNFNNGDVLLDIGYTNMRVSEYKLC